jgi:hypothetical protein
MDLDKEIIIPVVVTTNIERVLDCIVKQAKKERGKGKVKTVN